MYKVFLLLQCYIGFAGDGLTCGFDRDSDGYPDKALDCKDKYCVKVQFIHISHHIFRSHSLDSLKKET